MTDTISLRLTPVQAKILFNTVDGAADAGSCEGGCTNQELKALASITEQLLAKRSIWGAVKLDPA